MKGFTDPQVFGRVKRLPVHASAALAPLREAARRHADVIDLASAPQPAPPEEVVEAFRAAVADARWGEAADPRGTRALREAAAGWLKRRRGLDLDPEREIVATLGNEEGLGHALQATLQDGDVVLTPTPAGASLAQAAVLAGGVPVPVPAGRGVDPLGELVAAAERSERRPRALLVSSPLQPVGTVASPELLAKLVRFAEGRALLVISDACHAELALDGPPAALVLQAPGARDRTLELVTLASSHGMAGFGVGFAAGNAALVTALARVRSYLGHGPLAASQAAAVAALTRCDDAPARFRELLRRRREALVRHFGAAGLPVPPPAATPFAWVPLPEALRPFSAAELCRRVAEEAGVLLAPGSAFGEGGEGFVRVALAHDEPVLAEAAARVGAALEKLRAEPRAHAGHARTVEHVRPGGA